MKEKWTTINAPVPVGKIAQVSIAGKLGIGYISGLISQAADGTVLKEKNIAEQTEIVLDNLKTIVEDMGLSLDHVIKTNVFLSNMENFDRMNEVYGRYFSEENPPARQCVESKIWGGLLVEISAEVILR